MRRPDSGYVLIFVTLIFTGLAMLTTVGLTRSMTGVASVTRSIEMQQATTLAEAGLDDALSALGADPTLTVCPAAPNLLIGTVTCTMTSQPGNLQSVQVTGFVPNAITPRAQQTLQATVEIPPPSVFQQAVFGSSEARLEATSNLVDSYNSGLGPYTPDPGTGNRASNGTVRTNSTGSDAVRLENANVYGKVWVGAGPPAGVPSVVIRQNNSYISGAQEAAPSNLALPTPTVPAGVPCTQAIHLSPGETKTLPAGVQCYTEITAANGAQLLTAGPATVYVNGTIDVDYGKMAGAGDDPTNLTLIVTTTDRVELEGMLVYGAIYAPNAQIRIELGGGNYFGSFVANEFRVECGASATTIHFDEALKNVTVGGLTKAKLRLWRQP